MTKLQPIQTPFGAIEHVRYLGREKVKQNNVTEAMGYGKFLSRNKKRGSGLGKYLHGEILTKLGNVNYLDLEILVNDILPDFLQKFWGLIQTQPSRKQFFRGRKPEEIYSRSKTVYEILKERLVMGYDPNSLEAQKGSLGEKIVKDFLEEHNCNPIRPRDSFKSGASIVDFEGTDADKKLFLVEVKTQIAAPYGIEKAPCYSFPKSRIEAYKEYSKKRDAPVDIHVVDPSTGFVYFAMLDSLEREQNIDARKFPFDQNLESLNSEFHYWHRDQFKSFYPIQIDDLIKLRKLFNITADQAKEICETSNLKLTADITTNPKSMIENLAAFVALGKEELTQAILDLRQKKFDREQAQMKELFS